MFRSTLSLTLGLVAASVALLIGQAAAQQVASSASSEGSAGTVGDQGSCQFRPTLTCYLASTQSLDTQGQPSKVTGKVDFSPFFDSPSRTCRTKITGTISGLGKIDHGWHVHQKGDISNNTGSATGDHYNPSNVRPPNTRKQFHSLFLLVVKSATFRASLSSFSLLPAR
jgi:Cu/Zn superoxide dismutase